MERKIHTGSLSILPGLPGPVGPGMGRYPGDSTGGSDPRSRPFRSTESGRAATVEGAGAGCLQRSAARMNPPADQTLFKTNSSRVMGERTPNAQGNRPTCHSMARSAQACSARLALWSKGPLRVAPVSRRRCRVRPEAPLFPLLPLLIARGREARKKGTRTD